MVPLLRYFEFGFKFAEIFTFSSNSAVYIRLQSQENKISHKLYGVHPTTESESELCLKRLSQTAYYGVGIETFASSLVAL